MKKMTNNTKFDIVPSNKFNKQLKKITKQGKKTDKLKNIILKLNINCGISTNKMAQN